MASVLFFSVKGICRVIWHVMTVGLSEAEAEASELSERFV